MILSIRIEMATLTSSTLRTALVDYRAELLRMTAKRPEIFGAYHDQLIAQIDDVLFEIEGNISSVSIIPLACKE
jgi:hypothetical protein